MDIADVRIILSCLALQRSIERGDEEWETGVVKSFYRLERMVPDVLQNPEEFFTAWEQRNREFHLALEAACGSPWLLHFSEMTYSQSERYRRQFVRYDAILPHAQDEHKLIMHAALDRNPETACDFLRRHIEAGIGAVRDAMKSVDTNETSDATHKGEEP